MPECSECDPGNDFACTCPANCNGQCNNPVRCGTRGLNDDGQCTPFYFQPDTFPNCDGSAPYFGSGEIVPTSYYQVYSTSNPDEKWVAHSCDHAGIQTDCKGDIGYLEFFGGYGQDYGCQVGVQGVDHNACSFSHPAGLQFGTYSCGWWRAYDNGWDASAWQYAGCNLPGGGQPLPSNCYSMGLAVTDGGLMGPPSGNDWFTQVVYALRNCEGCTRQEGALINPFTDDPKYSQFFMGTTMPWVCNVHQEGPAEYVYPYTLQQQGDKYVDCYCDNEPFGGREDFPLEPNWNTGILYCGLVAGSDYMDCVLITLVKDDWSKDKCGQDMCGGHSQSTQVFQLAQSDWGTWG